MASETRSSLSKDVVLSKATLKAAIDLGLNHAELGQPLCDLAPVIPVTVQSLS